MTNDKQGHVYILTSPKIECIKIGGTDYPPLKRIKEINTSEPYKNYAPWSLADFRQVSDWRKVEAHLHYTFRSKLNIKVKKQKELFHISPQEASIHLNNIDATQIIGKPKIDRMFQDEEFYFYLETLFRFTGILNWLNIQGSWTLSLFPATGFGRYFTINIGGHEVAFSTLARKDEQPSHMILMDKLILDFPQVSKWIERNRGSIELDMYETALPRSASISFSGHFKIAHEFFQLEGVRRALIAYWTEALIGLKERNAQSLYARYHHWNAVAEIYKRIIESA